MFQVKCVFCSVKTAKEKKRTGNYTRLLLTFNSKRNEVYLKKKNNKKKKKNIF